MGERDPLAGYTPDWRTRRLPIAGQAVDDDPLAGYTPDWRARRRTRIERGFAELEEAEPRPAVAAPDATAVAVAPEPRPPAGSIDARLARLAAELGELSRPAARDATAVAVRPGPDRHAIDAGLRFTELAGLPKPPVPDVDAIEAERREVERFGPRPRDSALGRLLGGSGVGRTPEPTAARATTAVGPVEPRSEPRRAELTSIEPPDLLRARVEAARERELDRARSEYERMTDLGLWPGAGAPIRTAISAVRGASEATTLGFGDDLRQAASRALADALDRPAPTPAEEILDRDPETGEILGRGAGFIAGAGTAIAAQNQLLARLAPRARAGTRLRRVLESFDPDVPVSRGLARAQAALEGLPYDLAYETEAPEDRALNVAIGLGAGAALGPAFRRIQGSGAKAEPLKAGAQEEVEVRMGDALDRLRRRRPGELFRRGRMGARPAAGAAEPEAPVTGLDRIRQHRPTPEAMEASGWDELTQPSAELAAQEQIGRLSTLQEIEQTLASGRSPRTNRKLTAGQREELEEARQALQDEIETTVAEYADVYGFEAADEFDRITREEARRAAATVPEEAAPTARPVAEPPGEPPAGAAGALPPFARWQERTEPREVPTTEIDSEPERFQYKVQGVGEEGVTDQFAGMTEWKPGKRPILVWRDPADGRYKVIDGHHRFHLAQRLAVPAVRVSEITAPDAETARIIGALANVATGKGTAVDAAGVFREAGITREVLEQIGISADGPIARDALALAELDEPVWREVASGRLGAEQALEMGRAAPAAGAPATGERRISDNVAEVPVQDIDIEPERFQFKFHGIGEGGVGEELKSVKRWDPNLAGIIQVWRDPADGRLKVVNGHHRLDLARRLGVERILAREIDAPDAATARMIGAMTNIAEGRGTPIDAAKLFRDEGLGIQQLEEAGISIRGALARDGLALANLHQTLFQEVAAGRLPVARAAVIGRSGLDHEQQLALWQLLQAREQAGRRLTNEQIAELIRFVKGAGETSVSQESLFGEEVIRQSLAVEKAQLSAAIKQRLAKDRRLFSYVAKGGRARRIAERGVGQINVERAGEIAQGAAAAEEVYDRLSTLSGPVGDALNEGAARLARGEAINAVTEDTYERVRDAIRAELERLQSGAGARGAATAARSGEPAAGPVRAGAAGAADEGRAPDDAAAVTPPADEGPGLFREAGAVSPELLRTLGGAAASGAAGAALDEDSPVRGAAVGAVAGGTGVAGLTRLLRRLRGGQAASASVIPSRDISSAETGRPRMTERRDVPEDLTQPPASGRQSSVKTRPSDSTTRATLPPTQAGPSRTLRVGAIDPTSGRKVYQPTDNIDTLLRLAQETLPELEAALRTVSELSDGRMGFTPPRVKGMPRLQEKLAENPARTISDYLGGRLHIDTIEDAVLALAHLQQMGWRAIDVDDFLDRPKLGYRAVHVQLQAPTGISVELQIIPREIAEVQEEAHHWYEILRRPDVDAATFEHASQMSQRVFDEAWARFQARVKGSSGEAGVAHPALVRLLARIGAGAGVGGVVGAAEAPEGERGAAAVAGAIAGAAMGAGAPSALRRLRRMGTRGSVPATAVPTEDLARLSPEELGRRLADGDQAAGEAIRRLSPEQRKLASAAWRAELMAVRRAREAKLAPLVTPDLRQPIELDAGREVLVVSREPDGSGRLRITTFTEDGPMGHVVTGDPKATLDELLDYTGASGELATGRIDEWSRTERWARGLEQIRAARELNRALARGLNPPDRHDLGLADPAVLRQMALGGAGALAGAAADEEDPARGAAMGAAAGLGAVPALRRLRSMGTRGSLDLFGGEGGRSADALEVQDDLFGAPRKVAGSEQRDLFQTPGLHRLVDAERQARATVDRLRLLVERGAASSKQLQQYRDALALLRRGAAQSAEEVRLRAAEAEPTPDRPARDERVGDLFGSQGAAPPEVVRTLAATGTGATVGAAIDEDDRLRGAVVGGLAGAGIPGLARLRQIGRAGSVPAQGDLFRSPDAPDPARWWTTFDALKPGARIRVDGGDLLEVIHVKRERPYQGGAARLWVTVRNTVTGETARREWYEKAGYARAIEIVERAPGRSDEIGAASPEVLRTIASAGLGAAGGAALAPDDERVKGAIAGGLAGTGLSAAGGSLVRLGGTLGGALRRNLTVAGDLPESVFRAKIRKDAWISAQEREIAYTLRAFRRAAREAFGGESRMTAEQTRLVDRALKGEVLLEELPEAMREPVRQMREHIDALSRRLIDEGVVEGKLVATVTDNLGAYATRSYRVHDDPKWAKKVSPEVRNKAKAWLRAEYPEKGDAEIDGLLEALLFQEDAPIALLASGKLGSKDLSILRRRKDIAPELRALWGEYEDARVNYTRSVTKMANLIANHRFLEEVRRTGRGEILMGEGVGKGAFLWDEPIVVDGVAYNAKIAADESSVMAPLNGLYTTPEILRAFQEAMEREQLPDWLRLYMKLNGTVKFAKTVGSLMTQVRNLIGNVGFATANGHWRVGKAGRAARAVLADIGAMDDAQARDYFKKLAELGVVGESARAGELRDVIRDASRQGLDRFAERWAERAGAATLEAVQAAYRAEDDVWKVYAFENELARYRRALPDLPEEELERRAAEIVRNTYPTYSMIPRGVKKLRRFPLVGTFVSFPSEVFRTLYNTLELTARELSDPALRSIGAQRLAGLAVAATAVGSMATASRFLTGVTSDDDQDVRRFLPEWSENSSLLYLGRDEDGKIQYIDLSYTDPYSYIRSPLIAFMRGENWQDAVIQAALQATRPFLEEEIFAQKFLDIARNQKRDGGRVYNPEDSPQGRFEDMLAHVLEAMVPGTATSANRIYRGITGKETVHGRSYDPQLEALAVFTGHRISELDLPQALSFRTAEHERQIRDAERLLTSVASRRGTVTEEELADAHEQMERSRRRRFLEAHEDAQAALRLGIARGTVWQILATSGFSDDEAGLVLAGRYIPWEPGDRFLEGVAERTRATDKAEGRERANTITGRLRQLYRLSAAAQREETARRTAEREQRQRLPGAKPEAVAQPAGRR